MASAPQEPTRSARRSNPNLVLAMVLAVYCFSYLDRMVLSVLADPIKADLDLSDTQMGMLGGLAFALLYATMGVPLALVADRRGKSTVITVSLVVWSGFTALCGFATNFWHMFLARLGVGIGEAGGSAPSYALISDYFPPAARARATAIYMMGIPLGSAAGVYFGGWIADLVDWRVAIISLGLAGIALALPFRLLVRDPPSAEGTVQVKPPPLREGFAELGRKSSFWIMCIAGGFGSMCTYGLNFWLPSVLGRSFGLSLYDRGAFHGALLLIGGCAGMWIGGWLADRLGRRDRAAFGRIPAYAMWASLPLFAAGLLSGDAAIAFAFLLPAQALSSMWAVPVLAGVQHLGSARHRSTATACFLFFANAIGFGLGTPVLGWLSDTLHAAYGDESLRYAMLGLLSAYVVAGALMLWAAPAIRRDWVE